MHVTARGLFAVLVLTAPVAAVPLFAVFGIPEMPLLVASSAYDWTERAIRRDSTRDDDFEFGARLDSPSESSWGQDPFDSRTKRNDSPRRGTIGSRADLDRNDRSIPEFPEEALGGGWTLERPSERTGRSVPLENQPSRAPALNRPDSRQRDYREPRNASLTNATSRQDRGPRPTNLHEVVPAMRSVPEMQPVNAAPQAGRTFDAMDRQPSPRGLERSMIPPAVTWKDAVNRLNQLGIRQFRLEPGTRGTTFMFTCQFTSAENPRVLHRFEAEADEPLQAVEQVLEQLDVWRSR